MNWLKELLGNAPRMPQEAVSEDSEASPLAQNVRKLQRDYSDLRGEFDQYLARERKRSARERQSAKRELGLPISELEPMGLNHRGGLIKGR